MDIFLLLVGFLLVLLGIVGAILPVLPGPLTGWFGLLALHFTSVIPLNWTFLGITLAIALIIWILDYIIPAMGTKKFGGSKYGVYGTTIGLIIGLFVPIPLGILIGAFLGAFIGELLCMIARTPKELLKLLLVLLLVYLLLHSSSFL